MATRSLSTRLMSNDAIRLNRSMAWPLAHGRRLASFAPWAAIAD